MRYFITLACMLFGLLSGPLSGQVWEDQKYFNRDSSDVSLRILSSTDTPIFSRFINSFVAANPDIGIEYLVAGTADVDRLFRADASAFDIVISSAMDLQLKLTNDGFALVLKKVMHPDWAQWRSSLFAFTSEPAAIVINRDAFANRPIPKTRQDLIEALRAEPEQFRKRIGTYDIRGSGLGYLFATQDARSSETYWRLMEVMGSLDAKLYCCSGRMIDELADGRILVAYNVLGSYAAARKDIEDKIEIILPANFPTTMMRTALVSKETKYQTKAEAFIRHLIKQQTRTEVNKFGLPALTNSENSSDRTTIVLEPALLTFLDALKRKKFISEWEDAVIQNQ